MLRLSPYRYTYVGMAQPTYTQMIADTDASLLALGFTKEAIGTSQDGGFTIYGYKYGDFAKPTVWIDSNIHGSEWWTAYFCLDFFERVVSLNFYDKEAIKVLRDAFSWYYIPSLNPWGFENTQYNNINQVNISRNFDNMWEQYVGNPQGQGNAYKGEAVWSEAESRAARDKFLEILPYLAINTHTTFGAGSGIDVQARYKWYSVLMRDVLKASKLIFPEAITTEWNTQFSPQASGWYGSHMSKEGKRVISTIFEHQSDAEFNYGLNTLFLLCFAVLNYYQNGKMKMNSLSEIKR